MLIIWIQTLECRNDSNNLCLCLCLFSLFFFKKNLFIANETNAHIFLLLLSFFQFIYRMCANAHTQIHTTWSSSVFFPTFFSSLFCLKCSYFFMLFFSPLIFILFLYICFAICLIALSFSALYLSFSNSVSYFFKWILENSLHSFHFILISCLSHK